MATQGTIGYGRKVKPLKNKWEVFDSMPRDVREAYANAAFDWSIRPGATAVSIRASDQRKVAEDRTRVWGWSKVESALADLGLDD